MTTKKTKPVRASDIISRVSCPYCGSKIGELCQTIGTYGTYKLHDFRIRNYKATITPVKEKR